MTNDELQKMAEGLADCGKALLRIADTLVEKKEEKKLTLEDVRRLAADKARQGYTEEVRQLIQKFGADMLSGVDAAKYPALMEELEAIGHAK